MISSNQPKISIITVVFNGEKYLEETIQSVINQTYDNVEYIIIDGGSTDGTVDIIKKYESQIHYWVSEKDKGIYDAMNKGIKVASGAWLNFMNAGDTFIDNSIIDIIKFERYNSTALLYGNKIQDHKVIYPHNIDKLACGEIMACHQSMFFNKNFLMDDLIYDLTLPIYGDYELVNKIYCKKLKIKYINLEISNYAGEGVSSFVSAQKRKDKYKTLYKYYGVMGLVRGVLYRIFKK